jgi:PAS domain S-box-containing protein
MPYSSEDARLHAVVNTAVHGVILIDSAGTVLMFNPACERLFGYRADEVIGQNVKMLMPSPYREGHDGYLGNYMRSGQAKVIGIGREVQGRRKDGSVFPMDLQIGEARENDTVAFVGIIHDLTERKRTELALRESANRLKAVVETAVDGVILIDMQGIVLMFNPACERLFGYRTDEVVGKNVRMLMPAPYRGEHDRYIANYLHTGDAKIIGIGREVVGQRKDGTTFPMDLSVGEAKQEEGGSIFVGIIHDLTSRKRTEEQLAQAQKMEAVGQLSGGLAHDFNNLLTVVVGNAETLSLALKARPDLKQAADMIATAGERGAELTRRLLAFSRRQMLQPAQINCNRLIDSMQRMLWRTLREDIEIRIALAPDLWPAFADAGQLESAILNLAINARDAMPDGGGLSVSTANVSVDEHYRDRYPEVTPGNYVLIAVTDTGDGMPPEVLSRAFEPFFTTKEVGKGSGLGLSMVYGFMKQSNGHVSIYSEVGLGTTVRLYLPAHSTMPADVAVANTGAEGEPPRGQETVLVTEDDPFVRAYVVSSLEELGYRVIAAQDAREALTHLTQGDAEVDLLFTDIVMPGGMNGWELAERAQQIQPGLKLLFTSGYALETLVARGRIHPDTAILNKPYRRPELARRLREVLDSPQVVAAPPSGK